MNTWAYLDLGVVVAIAKLGTSYFHSSPAGVQIVVHYLVNPGKYVSQEKGKKLVTQTTKYLAILRQLLCH